MSNCESNSTVVDGVEEERESASFSSSADSNESRSSQDEDQTDPANNVQNKSFPVSKSVSLSVGNIRRIFQNTGLDVDRIEANFSVNVDLKITVSGEDTDCIDNAIQSIDEQLKRQSNEVNIPNVRGETREEKPAERLEACPVLTKMYMEDPKVALMRTKNNITVKRLFLKKGSVPHPIPSPVLSIDSCFGRYPQLRNKIRLQGIEKLSSFQSQACPILLSGEDMLGITQSNADKMFAIILLALVHIEEQQILKPESGGPFILILTPNHHLALQLETEIKKYSPGTKTISLFNCNRNDKRSNIRIDITIASPRKVNNFVEAEKLSLKHVSLLILYEFNERNEDISGQILQILLHLRPDRQTVMTVTKRQRQVCKLVSMCMTNPIEVRVEALAMQKSRHVVELVAEDKKSLKIQKFIKNMRPNEKVVIFCNEKQRAQLLCRTLSSAGLKYFRVEDLRDQPDREQIIVATDICSRGLVFDNISYVINFDFPRNLDDYVERVCCLNESVDGTIICSYFAESDYNLGNKLIQMLKKFQQNVPDELQNMVTAEYGRLFVRRIRKKRSIVNEEKSAGDGRNIKLSTAPKRGLSKPVKQLYKETPEVRNIKSCTAPKRGLSKPVKQLYKETPEVRNIKSSTAPKRGLSKPVKQLYKEAPEVSSVPLEEIAPIRKEGKISVDRLCGKNSEFDPIPDPVWTFEHCFAEFPSLMRKMREKGLEKPSPLQSQAWPVLLRGEDMVCIAPTGDDKMLACILPAFIHTLSQSMLERHGPCVLILTPTSSLACQLEGNISEYSCDGIEVRPFSNERRRRTKTKVSKPEIDIMTATPESVIDLIRAKKLNIKYVSFVILYEFNHILGMAFDDQISTILASIRPDRQTVVTSSAWSPHCLLWIHSFLKHPIHVYVDSIDVRVLRCAGIEEKEKNIKVREFLATMKPDEKAVIFCNMEEIAEQLCVDLSSEGFVCQYAGDLKKQSDPIQVFTKILIATSSTFGDFNSRNISYVVNFDFPPKMEDYVQRLELMKQAGICISFFEATHPDLAPGLIDLLQIVDQEVPKELVDIRDSLVDRNLVEIFESMGIGEAYPCEQKV